MVWKEWRAHLLRAVVVEKGEKISYCSLNIFSPHSFTRILRARALWTVFGAVIREPTHSTCSKYISVSVVKTGALTRRVGSACRLKGEVSAIRASF